MECSLHRGDMRAVLAGLEPESTHACVTDPPYGLGFMGKGWDAQVPGPEFWRAVYRVLKPGAHLVAFAGTRTWHRMACAIEDSGFELRDTLMWVYGSGFPKSLDVSKAIDKEAGAERESKTETVRDVFGVRKVAEQSTRHGGGIVGNGSSYEINPEVPNITVPATPAAAQWQGWGTALKPAWEPALLFRRPFPGTVAANVQQHSAGALNIDGCRIDPGAAVPGGGRSWGASAGTHEGWKRPAHAAYQPSDGHSLGRWPANLCHDGSPEVLAGFPETGASNGGPRNNGEYKSVAKGRDLPHTTFGHADSGSAARFFYCAKASRSERNKGLEHMAARRGGGMSATLDGSMRTGSGNERNPMMQNHHPTVKPVDLMRWLVRLVTPPAGTVLDPFMGSGSTGIAAKLEGFDFIGVDLDPEYVEIARARIAAWEPEPPPGLLALLEAG